MARLSKRAKAIRAKVDSRKLYPVVDAIALVKECSVAKFDESVDVWFARQLVMERLREIEADIPPQFGRPERVGHQPVAPFRRVSHRSTRGTRPRTPDPQTPDHFHLSPVGLGRPAESVVVSRNTQC